MIEWKSTNLRSHLTVILELPSSVRTKSLYWGVVEEGNAFEVLLDKAKELSGAEITLKNWLNLEKSEGGFDKTHPKFIVYKQILETKKESPVDVPRKVAHIPLNFQVESKIYFNIYRC